MTVPTNLAFTHMKPGRGPSKIRARVDVHYGDFLMRGFEVREGPGGGLYVRPPSRQDRGGWITTVFLPEADRRKAFERFVLDAYARDVRAQEATEAEIA